MFNDVWTSDAKSVWRPRVDLIAVSPPLSLQTLSIYNMMMMMIISAIINIVAVVKTLIHNWFDFMWNHFIRFFMFL